MQDSIRIGTLVALEKPGEYIRTILPHGFESFSIFAIKPLATADLHQAAQEVKEALADSGAVISSLCFFGNPLMDTADGEVAREMWRRIIDAAPLFGCDIVAGFTGRLIDEPIDACIPRFAEVFGELGKRAADQGVRIAFENCEMGGTWQRGDWNIAHTPIAWEMMFDALPMDNLGPQWEPCHQMVKLIDPMPQLRSKWVKKFFHIHGKDATILWDVVRQHGIGGSHQFAFHRTPGFGDSNWTDIISELRRSGFTGSIDIEGWHDPVYRGELEMMGQVHGLNYLKWCRGGSCVPSL